MGRLDSLDRAELKRRIEAARLLRGLSQEDLNKCFVSDGLDKQEAGRLERGEAKVPLTRARVDALVRHLGVPEAWFTEPDIDAILYPDGTSEDVPHRLSQIEERIRTLGLENEARAQDLAQEVREQIAEGLRKAAQIRLQQPG